MLQHQLKRQTAHGGSYLGNVTAGMFSGTKITFRARPDRGAARTTCDYKAPADLHTGWPGTGCAGKSDPEVNVAEIAALP